MNNNISKSNNISKINSNNNKNDNDNDSLIEKYMKHMSDKEKLAFEIAKDHLGSSFDIEKCIGFKKFVNKNKN